MFDSLKSVAKRLIPDPVLLGFLVIRRSGIWKKNGMIFVHVPKNGGTSINQAVYGRFMGHCRVEDIERFRPDLLASLPSLAIIRNPWARLYSAWRFSRQGARMKDGVQIANPRRYQSPQFSTFERFVLEWLPCRDLNQEDYVFRPQSHFILSCRGEIGVSHIGQIENQQSYLFFLEEILGRRVEIGRINVAGQHTFYRNAYSPEMIEIASKCYASDIERFNYDF